MKIMFVVRSWRVGGEQRSLSLVAAELALLGHQVSVLVLSAKSETDQIVPFPEGAGILFARSMPSHSQRHLSRYQLQRSIRIEITRHCPQVVVGFGTAAAIYAILGASFTGVPVVVCERSDPRRAVGIWRLLRSILYRRAAGAIFQTSQASQLLADIEFPMRSVIPNPVSPRVFELPQVERRDVIVNTSRHVQGKGLDELLDAFAVAVRHGVAFNLHLYGDGPETERLRLKAKSLGVSSRVLFLAPSNTVLEEVNRARIFVLPSYVEGFPNALLEAMGLGLACISTDCPVGAPRELLGDQENGILVPVRDVRALWLALEKLSGSDALVEAYGRNAQTAATAYLPRYVALMWEDSLKMVVGNPIGFFGRQSPQ